MPVLSTKLWMFTLGFLPKARRAKTLEAVHAMERSALAARPLRALTQCYEEGIFATGSSEENLFIYFKKKTALPLSIYKLHISVDYKDYPDLLTKSSLNRRLQQYLSSSSSQTIGLFKCVDPHRLNDCIKLIAQYKNYIDEYYALIEQQISRKNSSELLASIKLYHQWLILKIPEGITCSLSDLLQSDLETVQSFKQQTLVIFKEICECNLRLKREVQYTLYLHSNFELKNLIILINELSNYLKSIGMRSVPCPETDAVLTPFISMRQDRFSQETPYVPSYYTRETQQLKNTLKQSEIYQMLQKHLRDEQETTCNTQHLSV